MMNCLSMVDKYFNSGFLFDKEGLYGQCRLLVSVNSQGNSDDEEERGDIDDIAEYIYEDEEEPEKRPKGSGASPFSLFIKLFISPLKGWKSLKNSTLRPEQVASGCFYPMLALASVSVFMGKFYDSACTLTQMLIDAVGVFISFFIGYFLTMALSRMVLRGDASEKLDGFYGRSWLMYIMSTLALFFIIAQIFPPLEPVVVFLPLYSIYLTLRGVRFLRLKESKEQTVAWTVAILSIAIPSCIYYLFEAITPVA